MLDLLKLDHAVIPMFARMQSTGVPIDRPGCLALAHDMEVRFNEVVEELHGVLGYYINPNSDDQVRDMLFERLPAEMAQAKLTKGGVASTGKKVVEAFRGLDPAVDLLIEGRQVTKIKTTYALPLAYEKDPPPPAEPNRARSNLRVTRVASGRLSASVDDENGGASLLTLPTRTELGRRVRKQCRVHVPGRKLLTRDLCLAPGTRVLTADLRWAPIETLQVGQRVIGCDEHVVAGQRKLRTATVERTKRRTAICYEIHTADGRCIVASEEHPWLARTRTSTYPARMFRWWKTKDLRVGQELCKLVSPWGTDDSREAGWLAGVFDGEGSLDKKSATLTFTQNLGTVFAEAYDALARRGYRFQFPGLKSGGFPGSGESAQMWTSGIADCMHFVGAVRPYRLLEGIEALWEGKNLRPCRHAKGSVGDSRPTTITAIRVVGVREVIALQTDTSTFVAEGFVTHNSQIEFRVVAHLSEDRTMCEIFHRGLDLHKQTASKIFGLPIDQLDPLLHRAPAKNAGFGILFGITAEGFRDQMRVMGVGADWPLDRCQQLLDEWFAVYPGVQKFISLTRAEAARQGYVADMAGRRRYLPGAASDLSWVREEAWRQAVSLKVQGSAQAILKTGMAELWPVLEQHWQAEGQTGDQYLEPLLQVHDELLWEAHEGQTEWWMGMCDAAMTTTTQLRIPITSSGGIGDDWGSLEK